MSDNLVYCGTCGAESFVGARFCMSCGLHLPAAQAADEAAAPVSGSFTGSSPGHKPLDPELADIDLSFDALVGAADEQSQRPSNKPPTSQSFRRLAQEDLRPIREFMIELEIGVSRQESIPACRAAIERLAVSARALDSADELCAALGEMAAAFGRLDLAPGDRIADESVVLKRAYASLVEQLPGDVSAQAEPAREAMVDDEIWSSTPEPNAGVDPLRSLREEPTSAKDPASEGPVNEEGEREYMMNNEDRPNEKHTIIEEGSHLKGTLVSSCPVDVRGRIDGELETPSLTVAPSGAVHGLARVGSVRSEGELAGEFDADTVELSGVVKDNTVIRARSMQVKLASQRGKLQVVFGECEVPAADARTQAAIEAPAFAADVSVEALGAVVAPFEQPRDGGPSEALGFGEPSRDDGAIRPDDVTGIEQAALGAGDDNGAQRGRRRPGGRGPRHSEPPPAVS
jgi:cytoskeletal protein CcmA (bactofilin family)